jgi:hypothetical protein
MVGSTPATRANQDTDRAPSLPRSMVQQIGRPTLLPTSSAENPACICGPGFGICATWPIVRQQTRSCPSADHAELLAVYLASRSVTVHTASRAPRWSAGIRSAIVSDSRCPLGALRGVRRTVVNAGCLLRSLLRGLAPARPCILGYSRPYDVQNGRSHPAPDRGGSAVWEGPMH